MRRVVFERALKLGALLLLAAVPLGAQQPTLRIGDATVQGSSTSSGALYPAPALESLGFRLSTSGSMLNAVLGADTLRFWATSPFFRRGARSYQLVTAAQPFDGVMHLPEQFFIQWLPAAWPDRFAYRAGALQLRQQGAPPVASTAPPQAQQTKTQMPQATQAQQPQPRAEAATPPRTAPRTDAERAAARTRVVVVDAGHGGRDPGKVGPNGLREKDVTLMIAQRLGAVLRERGYEVHLTRTTDTLIALEDRPKLANRWKGERPVAIFLSIHANAWSAPATRGYETFFLSEARTEDERRVAEMENEVVRFEERSNARPATGLDQVVNDLHSDFLMRASYDLASTMQEKLGSFHPGPNRGVKRAGFLVLVGSIMPAVLIETAFISNREEATLLGSQAFQQKVAWGIADGVDEFFRRNEHLWVQQ